MFIFSSLLGIMQEMLGLWIITAYLFLSKDLFQSANGWVKLSRI